MFAGTPAVAVPSLLALLDSGRHEVLAVLTRAAARAGRGRQLRSSPVAEVAAAHGIELLTPVRAGEPAFLDRLRELAPQCCPIVGYGGLLPAAALEVPPDGWVNLHFSVLPAWRGAAPVQHAIIAGDDVTGASTFRVEPALDTGPVYGVLTEAVRPRDTAGDVLDRLAVAGAQLLLATLDGIAEGSLVPRPQPVEGVSLAPKLTVADARVRWASPAVAVDRFIRGCTPAPGAWTEFRGDRLKLGPVLPVATADPLDPAAVLLERSGVLVGTASAPVQLGQVQPAGKAQMPALAWARGAHPVTGELR